MTTAVDRALSTVLPPLICGTATFTSQYNADPFALPTTEIVHRALSLGIRAFDTSPYYGPAEELLGQALDAPEIRGWLSRSELILLTKVGRISSSEFDYSPSWVRASVQRSLQRLRTSYVDVVYCHDVEFVSNQEVLAAVRELRRIRDETATLRYVGISGYPVVRLCELAELVLRETGEPLDAVMSYAHFTLQNTTLASVGLPRLRATRVDVVPNASLLGMGLLRKNGVPIGGQGDFHPAENGLRDACRRAGQLCEARGEELATIALEFALDRWIRQGEALGSWVEPASAPSRPRKPSDEAGSRRRGVSVIGVSSVPELDETMRIWRNLTGGPGRHLSLAAPGTPEREPAGSPRRRKRVEEMSAAIRTLLGSWVDFSWPSPGPHFVRTTAALAPARVFSSSATSPSSPSWSRDHIDAGVSPTPPWPKPVPDPPVSGRL